MRGAGERELQAMRCSCSKGSSAVRHTLAGRVWRMAGASPNRGVRGRMVMRGARAWGAQASVNPKAETVEELQARRKSLHLGMCKLLREDLSILAEKTAEEAGQTEQQVCCDGRLDQDRPRLCR